MMYRLLVTICFLLYGWTMASAAERAPAKAQRQAAFSQASVQGKAAFLAGGTIANQEPELTVICQMKCTTGQQSLPDGQHFIWPSPLLSVPLPIAGRFASNARSLHLHFLYPFHYFR